MLNSGLNALTCYEGALDIIDKALCFCLFLGKLLQNKILFFADECAVPLCTK